MSLSFVEINGRNVHIDYQLFNNDALKYLGDVDAKLFLYNKPSIELLEGQTIDMLLFFAIENKTGNYKIVKYNFPTGVTYLNNVIVPVKIYSDFDDSNIEINNNEVLIDGALANFNEDSRILEFGLKNYLEKRCEFKESSLWIFPTIFIKNSKVDKALCFDKLIISESISFDKIIKNITDRPTDFFNSYKYWKTEEGYKKIANDIGRITEQVALESNLGILTRKKLDRILKNKIDSSKLYEHIG